MTINLIYSSMDNSVWFIVLMVIGIIGIRVYRKTRVEKRKIFPLDRTDYISLIFLALAAYLLYK